MKACILEHKMLASRETYQLVICPTSQQVKKKKAKLFSFLLELIWIPDLSAY